LELFCWAGILFLARADDGIVVSGASVQDKPETIKGVLQKPQWKVFIQKGGQNYFFWSDSSFLGQKLCSSGNTGRN
jgi:hypothetical protein